MNNKITKAKVINGLKFIAENQDLNYQELIKGLKELNCIITIDDIKKEYPDAPIYLGLSKGYLGSGAAIIANVLLSEENRNICNDAFLKEDNNVSIYNFIRIATNDENYHKNIMHR